MASVRSRPGAALTIIAVGPALFATVGPTLIGIREQASDPESRRQLRIAQAIGFVSVVSLGVGLALLTSEADTVLIGTAVVVGLVMAGTYQWALNNPKDPQ